MLFVSLLALMIYVAIDEAAEKVSRQLRRKYKTKLLSVVIM